MWRWDAFDLFISPDKEAKIVEATTIKIDETFAWVPTDKRNDILKNLGTTDDSEVDALIGLM